MERADGRTTSGFAGYAVDLPGHSLSTGQPVNDVKKYASAVAEFIRVVEAPSPVYVVGQSMGSAITLTVALQNEELIDGLVLISAGAKMRVAPALLEALAAGQSNPDFMKLAFSPHTDPELVEEFIVRQGEVPVQTLFQDFSACNVFDVSQELERITLPTLIIVGQDDKLTPMKLANYLHNNIKDSKLEILENAGHMPMIERPQELNSLLAKFVTR